ncbi:MAG: glycosyltransferase family 4 protein [Fibrobacteres bacterium]|nr:glycosyltransferase family 4 protein [Fibrobacterota bacterium]
MNREKIKVLKLVTTYQSVVTILDAKLALLEKSPGIDLYVASSKEDQKESRICHGQFFEVFIPRTISPIDDIKAVWKLFRFMRKEKFDVVHTHTAKAGIVGALAAFFARIPLVCHTYHGLPFYEGQRKQVYLVYKWLELIFSTFRHTIYSQNRRDYSVLKEISFLQSKVVFEGNGVDCEAIDENVERDRFKVKGYFKDGAFRLLCVARLERVKRLEKFIQLVGVLKSKDIEVSAIIAGKGEDGDRLEKLIVENEIDDVCKIVYTPHIHALIAASDVVVLTSEKEGIPRSIMEAMALKKPVVATDVLGTQELVVNGVTGYLVPLENQDSFVNSVCELYGNPDLRKSMGEAGYQRVVAEFNERNIVNLWLKRYGVT